MAKVDVKQPIVDEIKAKIDGVATVVLVDYRGLTVEQDTGVHLRVLILHSSMSFWKVHQRLPFLRMMQRLQSVF